jgi:2-keto-4-pentenoate hydratase
VSSRVRSAADLLWECWQNGRRLEAIPEEVRPQTREEGYAVQAALERRSSGPLFGWKIAATSIAGQKHINVSGPLAGRLLRERVTDLSAVARSAKAEAATAELPFGVNHMKVAEAEFAFRMGRDLAPRAQPYSVKEVLDAVATLHPAIEVPDSRYDDFTIVGAPQLIADNACAHLFVLGPPAPEAWREIDLVEHRAIGTAGSLTREGKGANVLGDPRVALAWLVNELSGLGLTLKTGDVVTTGTCLVPLPIAPGVEVNADFGALGSVSARIV